jgi:hypothetical protein
MPTPQTPAARLPLLGANSVITLETNTRFSRAHSRTLSVEGNRAAAARSIRSGSD